MVKKLSNFEIKEPIKNAHGMLKGSKLVGVDIDTFGGE